MIRAAAHAPRSGVWRTCSYAQASKPWRHGICRVELKPTLQQLYDTVHATCKGAVAALEGLPRLLPEVLAGCAAAGPLPACLRWVTGLPCKGRGACTYRLDACCTAFADLACCQMPLAAPL